MRFLDLRLQRHADAGGIPADAAARWWAACSGCWSAPFGGRATMNRLLLILWSDPMLWQLYILSAQCCAHRQSLQGGWTLEHYQSLLEGNPPFGATAQQRVVGLSSTLLTLWWRYPAPGLSRLAADRQQLNVLVAVAAAFPYVLLFLALLQVARDLHLGDNCGWGAMPGLSCRWRSCCCRRRFATSRRVGRSCSPRRAGALAATALGCCR